MRFSLAGLAVVVLDQAAKAWIRASIAPGETWTIVPGLLHVTHVYNTGAAFGLFASQPLLLVVAAGAVLVYAWAQRRWIRRQPPAVRLGVALGLGGAVGNTIDRLWRGAVLDFLSVPFIPVFNVADMSIVAGVAILLAVLLFGLGQPAAEDRLAARAEGDAPAAGLPEHDEKRGDDVWK